MVTQGKSSETLGMVRARVEQGWSARKLHRALQGRYPDMDWSTRDDYIRAAKAKVEIRELNAFEKAVVKAAPSLDYRRYTGWRLWLAHLGLLEALERLDIRAMFRRMLAARKHKRPTTRPPLPLPPSAITPLPAKGITPLPAGQVRGVRRA